MATPMKIANATLITVFFRIVLAMLIILMIYIYAKRRKELEDPTIAAHVRNIKLSVIWKSRVGIVKSIIE